MIPDVKHRMLFALSQTGCLYMFDINSAKCIYDQQVNQTTMFLSTPHVETGGVYALDRTGRLFSFSVDESNIVNHISNKLNDPDLGLAVAKRCNLSGAGDVFKQKFKQAMASQDYQTAAKIASEAPQGVLRTAETIQAFQQAPLSTGQSYPDLMYFQLLLAQGPLNELETIGLCQRVLKLNQENGLNHIEKWLKENK
eukprot:UN33582